jgi:hypothetical protein
VKETRNGIFQPLHPMHKHLLLNNQVKVHCPEI